MILLKNEDSVLKLMKIKYLHETPKRVMKCLGMKERKEVEQCVRISIYKCIHRQNHHMPGYMYNCIREDD